VTEDQPISAGLDDEAQMRAVDRLTLFSDGVVAIAITLLAIDLPVPSGGTPAVFWSSVRDNSGHYAAFLLSFGAIAAAWSHHHDIFPYVRRTDARLRSLDTAWLLLIIVNPFATKLLTSHGHVDMAVHAIRFGFYALIQALISVVMILMVRHMTSHQLTPGLTRRAATGTIWQSAGMAVGFGLSIPVFFATGWAWVLWIVSPVVVARAYRRRHPKPADSGGPDPDSPDPADLSPGGPSLDGPQSDDPRSDSTAAAADG
jgi:uncharacterized membrane protein